MELKQYRKTLKLLCLLISDKILSIIMSPPFKTHATDGILYFTTFNYI